jgi:predicted O-methyltransferase YrrM
MKWTVIILSVGNIAYKSYSEKVLTHYFEKHNIPYKFVSETSVPTNESHPSWWKLICHRMFPEYDFILCWDLDLLPKNQYVHVLQNLDMTKLCMVWDTHARNFPNERFNSNFRYNGGLIGIPKSMADFTEFVFDNYAPGVFPSYEQYYLNDLIVGNNIEVHELPDYMNFMYCDPNTKPYLHKKFLDADLQHYTYDAHGSNKVEFIKVHSEKYFIDNSPKIFDTRNEMVKYYFKTGYKLCEVGVFAGDFAKELLKTSPKELILIDPWDSVFGSGDVDGNNFRYIDLPKYHDHLVFLSEFVPSLDIRRGFSYTILPTFPDKYFDGIYIDGDHSYEGCKKDLELSLTKIKPGGFIMGHDYEMNYAKTKNNYSFGVKKAVDEFCSKYGLSIVAKGMDGCVSYAIKIPLMNIIEKIISNNFTMVSKERLLNLEKYCEKFRNTNYSFVECGVAKGGCLALMTHTAGEGNKIYGFDSFEGMPEITEKDVGDYNKSDIYNGWGKSGDNLSGGIENVYKTFQRLNVDMKNVTLIKGFFNDTLNVAENIEKVGKIGILRLDGDWYESTKICLEKLYEKVVPGGVVIIDDYGHWVGAKRATDEFRASSNISEALIQTDYTEHYWVKRA